MQAGSSGSAAKVNGSAVALTEAMQRAFSHSGRGPTVIRPVDPAETAQTLLIRVAKTKTWLGRHQTMVRRVAWTVLATDVVLLTAVFVSSAA